MSSVLAWFARVILRRPMVLESYGLIAYPKDGESCRVCDEAVRAFMARLKRPVCAPPNPGHTPAECGPLTMAQAELAARMGLGIPETLSLCASIEEMGRG